MRLSSFLAISVDVEGGATGATATPAGTSFAAPALTSAATPATATASVDDATSGRTGPGSPTRPADECSGPRQVDGTAGCASVLEVDAQGSRAGVSRCDGGSTTAGPADTESRGPSSSSAQGIMASPVLSLSQDTALLLLSPSVRTGRTICGAKTDDARVCFNRALEGTDQRVLPLPLCS